MRGRSIRGGSESVQICPTRESFRPSRGRTERVKCAPLRPALAAENHAGRPLLLCKPYRARIFPDMEYIDSLMLSVRKLQVNRSSNLYFHQPSNLQSTTSLSSVRSSGFAASSDRRPPGVETGARKFLPNARPAPRANVTKPPSAGSAAATDAALLTALQFSRGTR